MSKSAQTKLSASNLIAKKNIYAKKIYTTYKSYILDEKKCLKFKQQWRKKIFKTKEDSLLDLELGPGTGHFLSYMAHRYKNRFFLAIELKYKALIKTAQKIGQASDPCSNAKILRYNARLLDQLFAKNELNNVYIYFPDPWPKKRHHKHRLINTSFIETLYSLQRDNSFVEIKTDHALYFSAIQTAFATTNLYREEVICKNLWQNSQLIQDNFITSFEKIFIKKNQAIYYLKYFK